ncbi:MAG: hypothetical protein WCF90_00275 [Methanomicrobiales archaeon]
MEVDSSLLQNMKVNMFLVYDDETIRTDHETGITVIEKRIDKELMQELKLSHDIQDVIASDSDLKGNEILMG